MKTQCLWDHAILTEKQVYEKQSLWMHFPQNRKDKPTQFTKTICLCLTSCFQSQFLFEHKASIHKNNHRLLL